MVIVLMGVAGSGKTTIGSLLARQLSWEFADADDYHSAANVQKMSQGIPLTDADREPWLGGLRSLVAGWITHAQNGVLACSALKDSYREELRVTDAVRFVYLRGSKALLTQRLRDRSSHYMKPQMLASQLATLEEPEDAVVVDVSKSPEGVVAEIRQKLGLD